MGSRFDWANQIRIRLRGLTVKRALTILLCAVLLLLPMILAVVYRDHTDNTSSADVFSVTLYDSDGKEFGYDTGSPKSAPANSLLWIFYHFPREMKQLDSAPGDPAKDAYVRAVTDLNGKKEKLTCYFSTIATSCYCIDEKGVAYSIPTVYSESFLGTAYAEHFYPQAKIPTLITIDMDSVLPTEVKWYYKNYNDTVLQAQRNPIAQTQPLYELTAAIGMSFSVPPDFCQAALYSGDILLYSGPMDRLSSLTPDTGNEMILSLHAVWNQENHPDSYGEVRYRFPIRIRNRSEFSLGSATIPAGGFTTLSCTNIGDLSKISYASDITGFTPTFHLQGDLARTLLVVPEGTPTGTYSVTVTYGASSQTFPIQVTEPPTPAEFHYPDVSLKDAAASFQFSLAKDEWLSLLRALPAPQGTDYFQGNFSDPAENGFTVGYTHGSRVQWKHDIIESAIGCEWTASSPDAVSVGSVQNGTVIETGSCALLGNYAVVDHGRGLRIWYGHLSDLDVERGDVLQRGQSVGKTGDGGAATGNGFLIVCTIYNEIIDPSLILGKEFQ